MELTQSFTVPFPPDAVWAVFRDIPAIAPCLPGVALDGPPEGDAVSGSLTVKLGPISASFKGKGTVALDDAARTGSISGSGGDAKTGSRAKGEARFTILPDSSGGGTGTKVDVAVDYSLSGALAQFGRGQIVQDLAGRLTAEFVRNLEALLASRAPAAAISAEAPAPTPPPAPAPAAQLDVGNLLLASLWAWVKRLFGAGR